MLLVCPGYTHTEFHERAGLGAPGAPEFFWQTPEQVVTAALRDLDRGRAVSFPGALNRTLAAVSSVTPAGVTRRAAGDRGQAQPVAPAARAPSIRGEPVQAVALGEHEELAVALLTEGRDGFGRDTEVHGGVRAVGSRREGPDARRCSSR